MAHQPHELRPLMARIPESLRHRLEQSAAKAGRSLNAELIHRLEQSYAKEKERGIEHRIEQKIDLATQNSTSASLEKFEVIGHKLDELMKIVSRK
jgi:Arc-like DNA binding domain